MNVSTSDHVHGFVNSARSDRSDRVERDVPSVIYEPQTPPIYKRLLPGTWHGEKLSLSSNKGSSTHLDSPYFPPNLLASPSPSLTSPKKTLSLSPGMFNSSPRSLPFAASSPSAPRRSTSLLERIGRTASSSNLLEKATVPSVYRYARKCQWEDFQRAFKNSSKDSGYVYKKDGTTVLHLAVMSRTGYINAFKSIPKEYPMASLEIIEELLKLNPEIARVRCTLNGYTPLVYACLVCSPDYDVGEAARMVRLLLKYCPDSALLFTKDDLSPVDIHIVSYSHHHKEKEDETALGRTSTSVLRALLTHNPDLANLRVNEDKVEGPIELLYKCNGKVFSEAMMDDLADDGSVRSDFTIPERRQQVIDTMKKWWIWTWAVMILKYGSKKQKKPGSRFAAVHTAAMQVGCPSPVLSIALCAFPRQVKQTVEDKDETQNLPLHTICSWPCHLEADTMLSTRKSMAIRCILEEYQHAVKATNGLGETALELALKTGTSWDGGVRRLVKAYPKSLKIPSRQTGLYPFMTAAANATTSTASKKVELQSIRTIYGLLRSNPKVLIQALQKGQVDR